MLLPVGWGKYPPACCSAIAQELAVRWQELSLPVCFRSLTSQRAAGKLWGFPGGPRSLWDGVARVKKTRHQGMCAHEKAQTSLTANSLVAVFVVVCAGKLVKSPVNRGGAYVMFISTRCNKKKRLNQILGRLQPL